MTSGEPANHARRDADGLSLDRLANCPDDATRDELLRRAGGHAALDRLAEEAESLAGRSVQQAIEQSSILARLADRFGGPSERSRVRRAQAHALAYGGRLEESLDMCAEAVELARDADPVEAARARLASMQALSHLGRLVEAVAAGQAARAELSAAGEAELAARAHLNLANVEKHRGNATEALAHLDLAQSQLGGDRPRMGIVHNARGEALLLVDEFAGAEEAFRTACGLYRDLGSSLHLAMVEGNLAEVLARQGRFHEALASYETARRSFEREGAVAQALTVRMAHAEALEMLGLTIESIQAFEQVDAALATQGRRVDAGRVGLGKARAQLRLQRMHEASRSLAAAADAFREANHARGEAAADLLRAELLLVEGDTAGARSLLEDLVGRSDSPILAAAAELHLGRACAREDRLDEAGERLGRAVEAATSLGVPTLLADALHARGVLHRQRGRHDEAVDDLGRAIAEVERVRGSLHAERARACFLGNRIEIYQALVRALLDRGGDGAAEAAFAVAERAKSRALLDVARGGLDLAVTSLRLSLDPDERALADEIERLTAELNALYSRLSDGEPNQRRFADGAWLSSVRNRERELEALEQRVAATSSARLALASPASHGAIAGAMPEEHALVEYFVAEGELLAWIVRPGRGGSGGATLVRDLADEATVAEAVGRVQFQLGRALRASRVGASAQADGNGRETIGARLERDFATASRHLHDLVIAPLREALDGARRLLVVPHGPLHLVPWPALRSERGWLVEEFEIELSPSASLWLDGVPGSDVPDLTQAAVIGVADDLAPAIDEEIREVAASLGTTCTLAGAEATVDRALEALRRAPIVHIACHGRFASTAPRSSGLRLADRWLTARDLERIRTSATLVTLSGCETGRTLVARGDELLGLVRGFLLAGARRLLVSLWSTHDEAATALMRSTYHSLALQTSIGLFDPTLALREAQLDMLDRRAHPVHWAPFILVGRS